MFVFSPHNCKEFIAGVLCCNAIPLDCPIASPKNAMASSGQSVSEVNGGFPQDGSRH